MTYANNCPRRGYPLRRTAASSSAGVLPRGMRDDRARHAGGFDSEMLPLTAYDVLHHGARTLQAAQRKDFFAVP